jgi:hypothetical protein
MANRGAGVKESNGDIISGPARALAGRNRHSAIFGNKKNAYNVDRLKMSMKHE